MPRLFRHRVSALTFGLWFVLAWAIAGAARATCVGDCNGDGEVTVDEILSSVNIALELAPLANCPVADRNTDDEVTVDEILSAVRAALTGCPLEPIFPADYAQTFLEVRGCRFSTEHEGHYIRVLADPASAGPYRANQSPLPNGTTIIKEEYSSPDCRPQSLVRWSVMKKTTPGFDAGGDNWRWQRVATDGTVLVDGKQTCLGCHSRPACSMRDFMCTEAGPPSGQMRFVLRSLPAALLSITGRSSDDVYAVGADPEGDDFGPLVLHYDGQRWRRLDPGVQGDLWWITTDPIDGAYYMSGENGLVLRYDLDSQQFARIVTPGGKTLFGIWGSSATNIYAVGGDADNETSGGVIWHFDGVSWSAVDLSSLLPQGVPTLFKVWGRRADDVYVVGLRGVALHYDGQRWAVIETPSPRPLFTVHGNEDRIVATGGFAEGVIFELEEGRFVDRATPGTPQMNGVYVARGFAAAAGVAASLALRTDTAWELVDTTLNTSRDFHAVWIDPEGGIWAVGGDLSVSLTQGMVAYSGNAQISGEYVDLSLCPPPAGPPPANLTVSFKRDIVPLLEMRGCRNPTCHGGPFPSSNYDLRSYAGMFGPGVLARSLRSCDVVPGQPEASFLLEKLTGAPRLGQPMPKDRAPLSAQEIQLIRTWILEGAYDDAHPTATPTATPRSAATPTTVSQRSCDEPGVICTIAGTGRAVYDGDGRVGTETSFYYPWSIAFDSQGQPLILDANNLRLRRLGFGNLVSTVMGTGVEDFPQEGALASQTPLHHASDIKVDARGGWFLAGYHVPVVFRVSETGRVHVVAGTQEVGNDGDGGPATRARLTAPFGVWPDEHGGLYIADLDAHVIRYVDSNGQITTVAGTGTPGYSGDGGPATQARLNGPARLAQDGFGNLYFVETKNHVLRRVRSDGMIETVAGTGQRGYSGDGGPSRQARFDSPYDLVLAPTGDILVVDTGNSAIRRVGRNGIVTTLVGTGQPGFAGDFGDARASQLYRPVGAALDAEGALWIADTFNNRVRRVARFTQAFLE